jgi:hypothetical protein
MICSECLQRIVELERLEAIHAEKLQRFRDKGRTTTSQLEFSALAIAEHDTKLDLVTARLELKRHQRNHPKFNDAFPILRQGLAGDADTWLTSLENGLTVINT